MKTRLLITLCLTAGLLVSCMKGEFDPSPESYTYPDSFQAGKTYTAIATGMYHQTGPNYSDGFPYLKISDNLNIVDAGNTLKPAAGRIFCQFRLLDERPSSQFYRAEIDWYESIALGQYGPLDGGTGFATIDDADDDGLNVIEDWMTNLEDGYLTIHYSAWWGKSEQIHYLVLTPDDKDKPLELTLRHDARDDERLEEADALVCFDINSLSNYIDEENKTVTIKWKNSAGGSVKKRFLFKGRDN